jgi:hypothetical protein
MASPIPYTRGVDLVAVPIGRICWWYAAEVDDRPLPGESSTALGQLAQDFLEEITLDSRVSVTSAWVLPEPK